MSLTRIIRDGHLRLSRQKIEIAGLFDDPAAA
jgi:hypothetical protein